MIVIVDTVELRTTLSNHGRHCRIIVDIAKPLLTPRVIFDILTVHYVHTTEGDATDATVSKNGCQN